jgi:hypothetical protein
LIEQIGFEFRFADRFEMHHRLVEPAILELPVVNERAMIFVIHYWDEAIFLGVGEVFLCSDYTTATEPYAMPSMLEERLVSLDVLVNLSVCLRCWRFFLEEEMGQPWCHKLWQYQRLCTLPTSADSS